MKRLFYLLLIVFLTSVTGIIRVDASSYNGRLYEVWHPDSGFTVFAEESNRYMDYNSWMIRSTTDNKIYYCIDPALPLEGATTGSHNLITNKSDILSISGMNESKYKRVQLLAYYGYGYKDDNVDHTNKKWYGITQVMIWRVMRPDLSWTFKRDRNSTPDSSLYLDEVRELNKLVDDYSTFPSFANKLFVINSGEEKTVIDTNNVFNKYSLFQSSTNVKLTELGNSLKIYSEYSGVYRIGYNIASKTNDKFGALVSSDFQDLIVMGKPEEQRFFFNIEVSNGFLEIKKHDKDNNSLLLKDAVYGIYDESLNFVKKIITDENGSAKTNLIFGNYSIKELEAPYGYKTDSKSYDISIDPVNNHIVIDTYDEVLEKSTLEFSKTDYSLDIPVPNTLIEIYKDNNELIYSGRTNKEGKIIIPNLSVGKYYIVEKDAPKYYKLYEDKMFFEVLGNGEVVKANMKNHRKEGSLKIIKKDSNTGELLKGVHFDIYFEDIDKVMFKGITDDKGEINIKTLLAGKYCIIETKARKGYLLDKNKHCFEITEDGERKTVIVKNTKNSIKVPKTNAFDITMIISCLLITSGISYFIYEKFN